MLTPSGILPDSQINAAITDVYRQLQDVRKIRFERRSDWSGEDAIYFRILISDDAAKTRLHETMKRVEATLESILDPGRDRPRCLLQSEERIRASCASRQVLVRCPFLRTCFSRPMISRIRSQRNPNRPVFDERSRLPIMPSSIF